MRLVAARLECHDLAEKLEALPVEVRFVPDHLVRLVAVGQSAGGQTAAPTEARRRYRPRPKGLSK